jgi:hypothetical protein
MQVQMQQHLDELRRALELEPTDVRAEISRAEIESSADYHGRVREVTRAGTVPSNNGRRRGGIATRAAQEDMASSGQASSYPCRGWGLVP